MGDGFRHEALFYAARDEFLEGTSTFIREGLTARAPVLVVVDDEKIELLRTALGDDVASRVGFADMREVGANPGRIIPAWQDFLDGHADADGVWGIGEPISAERSSDELVECHRHEALLNVAFDGGPDFELLCPYDTSVLPADVIAHARHTHPTLAEGEVRCDSESYAGDAIATAFTDPLPDAPASADEFTFDVESLPAIRRLVFARAHDELIAQRRAEDFVTAVNEIATNSILHGGGTGSVRIWAEADGIACEVADSGTIDDPLIGRHRPDPGHSGGFGHWIANQACDLVQVRTTASGSAVRLHLRH